MRGREPDSDGFVDRNGVKIHYEVFGSGEPTILLLPAWTIVHARQWKAQVPYLARHFRVVVVDGRGTGRCDRPTTADAYLDREYIDDAIAVLDETGTERAVLVGVSAGGRHALQVAAHHPDRVLGVVAVGPALPFPLDGFDFDIRRDTYDGWEKVNRHYWLANYPGFVEFFMAQMFTEPHSTKQREDGVGWGLDTDAETLMLTLPGLGEPTDADARAICRLIRCPVLVLHGDSDAVVPHATGVAVAERTGGQLVTLTGSGHNPQARDPVRTNLLVREFVDRIAGRPTGPRTWTRALDRRKRALFVTSPIGLGHARRDAAIADELRVLQPDLEIDWLVQEPVAAVLAARGERVHPAARMLAGEAAHIDSEAGEHDLHAFQAIRRMDEIQVANFHVFHEVADARTYDLVVADEAWDVDHFLHENPELKRSTLAWLTDFVGWLPVPAGGPAEAALAGDYNAEMVEHIARYPRLRDRSIFVGDPDDLVPDSLGPGLPTVREWTSAHFDFAGYVMGFEPPDRDALRARHGYRDDERVCVVTVGGSGVGGHLLRRMVAAYPQIERLVPGLRMIVVAGPRIDPASVPAPPGVEVLGYVPDLHRHLGGCDIAVVQGGLTTTMELVACRRPFLYFPLASHFEQQFHVPHRLRRYRAGRRMDYATTADPDALAAAVAGELARAVDYRPVATDGARRAAGMLAELL